jgi:four helix bundle protein
MATFKKFEEIESWKVARELTKQVYKVSNKATLSRDFALRDQIRRAAISVMSNIAEGYDQKWNRRIRSVSSDSKGLSRRGQMSTVCCVGPRLH